MNTTTKSPNPEWAARTAPDPLLDLARERFGIDYLFPYQRLVISNALEVAGAAMPGLSAETDTNDAPPEADRARRRQIVILPTGAGKSLCFQLPAPLFAGITIIVYPLLSLMSDQERRMSAAGLSCAVLRGGQPADERRRLFANLNAGAVQLLIANPEVLAGERVLNQLSELAVSHLVVDEAHCVSEWGESFRPSYLELGHVIGRLDPQLVTAFTATASPTVLQAVRHHLFGNEPCHSVEADPDRPNVGYSVVRCNSKPAALLALAGHMQRPAIIFCASRKRTEETARMLMHEQRGDDVAPVRFYHAGLEREEKEEVERWFFDSNDGILVATCAYGMGVDKSNIRTVVHRDVPGSVEAYLQESGRGGRDRERAEAILLVGEDDEARLRRMERETDGSPRAARDSLRFAQMLEYTAGSECRRTALMRMLGHESESCFGCDTCRERALADGDVAAGRLACENHRPVAVARHADLRIVEAAIGMVRANPRCYHPQRLSRILCGRLVASDREALRFGLRWVGSLRDLPTAAVEEAIVAMIGDGTLCRSNRLFKRRLVAGRDAS